MRFETDVDSQNCGGKGESEAYEACFLRYILDSANVTKITGGNRESGIQRGVTTLDGWTEQKTGKGSRPVFARRRGSSATAELLCNPPQTRSDLLVVWHCFACTDDAGRHVDSVDDAVLDSFCDL